MTTKTTWSALMLAASTLALLAPPLAAQEATSDPAATTTDPAADAAADATVTAEGETAGTEADATLTAEGEAATDGTDDATMTAEGEAATTDGTEADATLTAEGETATDGADDATMTAEGEAAAGTDTTATAEASGAMMEATVTADAGAVANPPETPNADMQAVLDKLAELGARPIEELSVEEARTQPTPADAVMAVMEERGIEMPAELAAIATRDVTYPAADGSEVPARIYTPEGEGPFPLIVYFHGGGWVIADIDTYDASARALAAGANAVVVSAHYRQAPEFPFPAQHEDANAAFAWAVENSGSFNADSERLAVAGESAGGNLAMTVAINARDSELTPIDHVLAVYPIANDEMTTPSYEAYADAAPLSRAGMEWFASHVFEDPAQAADPRVDLIERDDLAGLPPVTIVNAEIDPLQSEGEILAERLAAAGVTVEQMTYSGVAHEFFGMGAVVPEAQQAVDMATANLSEAFGDTAEPAASAEAAPADAAAEPATEAADAATETAPAGEVTEVEPTAADTPDAAEEATTEDGAAATADEAVEPVEGETATD